jgi:hypothetical protein
MSIPTFPTGHTVYFRRIPEIMVEGKRLGRNVRYDSRNARYPYQRQRLASDAKDQLWPRRIPILNQGDVGACTGNAKTGELGTEPFYTDLTSRAKFASLVLDESFALGIYSQGETIDGDGPYPPNDNGSSGPSVSQAAKNDGYQNGYLHITSVTDMVDALQDGPVIVGYNWYTSFDSPDANGLITLAPGATVRGGHETLVRGCKISDQLLYQDNSWGESFGVNGSFQLSFTTMDDLLNQQGDCTKSVPLSAPVPTPVEGPGDLDALLWYGGAGSHLANGAQGWCRERHLAPGAIELQRDLQNWAHLKGLRG